MGKSMHGRDLGWNDLKKNERVQYMGSTYRPGSYDSYRNANKPENEEIRQKSWFWATIDRCIDVLRRLLELVTDYAGIFLILGFLAIVATIIAIVVLSWSSPQELREECIAMCRPDEVFSWSPTDGHNRCVCAPVSLDTQD